MTERLDEVRHSLWNCPVHSIASPPPPSPELEPFCKNCGGIRSAHVRESVGLRCIPGRDSWFIPRIDAPPPSPTQETPAELTEALERLNAASGSHSLALHETCDCENCGEYRAAQNALVALYTRQREDAECTAGMLVKFQSRIAALSSQLDRQREETEQNKGTHEQELVIASLSSQLERLTEVRDDLFGVIEGQNSTIDRYSRDIERLTRDFEQAEEGRVTNGALYERAMADVERLKADSLTAEEAREIVRNENSLIISHSMRVTTPEIFAKLRRLSSDSGTGGEK